MWTVAAGGSPRPLVAGSYRLTVQQLTTALQLVTHTHSNMPMSLVGLWPAASHPVPGSLRTVAQMLASRAPAQGSSLTGLSAVAGRLRMGRDQLSALVRGL